jgi:hypothetical protein
MKSEKASANAVNRMNMSKPGARYAYALQFRRISSQIVRRRIGGGLGITACATRSSPPTAGGGLARAPRPACLS